MRCAGATRGLPLFFPAALPVSGNDLILLLFVGGLLRRTVATVQQPWRQSSNGYSGWNTINWLYVVPVPHTWL